MANCLSRRDPKIHLIFQNYAHWGTKVSYSTSFKTKGSVYRDGFIANNNHQFFRESHYQKLENIFFVLTL